MQPIALQEDTARTLLTDMKERLDAGTATMSRLAQDSPGDTRRADKTATMRTITDVVNQAIAKNDPGRAVFGVLRAITHGLSTTTGGAREAWVNAREYIQILPPVTPTVELYIVDEPARSLTWHDTGDQAFERLVRWARVSWPEGRPGEPEQDRALVEAYFAGGRASYHLTDTRKV